MINTISFRAILTIILLTVGLSANSVENKPIKKVENKLTKNPSAEDEKLSAIEVEVIFQKNRLKALNDLSYEIELTKSKAELAKIKKECQKNEGCLGTVVEPEIVMPLSTDSNLEKQKNLKAEEVLRAHRARIASLQSKLNNLSIDAIINSTVFFKNMGGSFKKGDVLYGAVKIINITSSTVTLEFNNSRKILRMGWGWL